MANDRAPREAADEAIRAYKLLLANVLDTRPSGARQRLADALGKHRSFITQITSPTYTTPIPQKHLATIFAVCHFSPAERDAFIAAYRKAHRGKLDIGDKQNAAFDKAVAEFISRMGALMHPGEGDE